MFLIFTFHIPNENNWRDLVVKKAIGHVPIEHIEEEFDRYIQSLKTIPSELTGRLLKNKSINNYIDVCLISLNFAAKSCYRKITGIKHNPLAGYERLPTVPRDRVFVDNEERRLKDVMIKFKSPLYQALCFSMNNPIRRGDLLNLRRENRNRDNNFIHFLPSKTKNQIPKETILVCIDDAQNEYWDSLPLDCPWLFPWIDVSGNWRQLTRNDFAVPWNELLDKATIKDFHWHDLKHVAITWMLDNGFQEIDLKNLGIQYTPEMIERYYHREAEKARKKWRKINGLDNDDETKGLCNRAAISLLRNGFTGKEIRTIGIQFDVFVLQNAAQSPSRKNDSAECEDFVKTPQSVAV